MIGYLEDIVQISAVLKENQASIFIKQGFTHRLRKGKNNMLYNEVKVKVKKARVNATGCLLGRVAPLIQVLNQCYFKVLPTSS